MRGCRGGMERERVPALPRVTPGHPHQRRRSRVARRSPVLPSPPRPHFRPGKGVRGETLSGAGGMRSSHCSECFVRVASGIGSAPPRFGEVPNHPGKALIRIVKAFHGIAQPLISTAESFHGIVQPLVSTVQSFHGIVQPLISTVQSFRGIVQPLVSTVQSFHGIVRPLVSTVQSFHGIVQPLTSTVQSFHGIVQALINIGESLNNTEKWRDEAENTVSLAEMALCDAGRGFRHGSRLSPLAVTTSCWPPEREGRPERRPACQRQTEGETNHRAAHRCVPRKLPQSSPPRFRRGADCAVCGG